MTKPIYFSLDIETDGPIPGVNSMLQLGCAAFTEGNGIKPISTFSMNIQKLDDAVEDAKTMQFWKANEKIYESFKMNANPPAYAMSAFSDWIEGISKARSMREEINYKPVAVAYPPGFDFTFIYWYFFKFLGSCPFSRRCIDISSYYAGMTKKDFHACYKRNFNKSWFSTEHKHTHYAVDDAIEQGILFINMVRDNRDTYDLK